MKEKIYKFLDGYVGDDLVCKPLSHFIRTWSDNYEICSSKGTVILWFSVRGDMVLIYRSNELCKMIEGYFSIDPNESWKYVRDWFGEKYNMKKLSDLFKFIPTK